MQINDIIDESIRQFGYNPQSSFSADVKEKTMKVTLVENVSNFIRGFSGFQEMFINADHFRGKIDVFKGDVELLQIIAKIDIISVSIHEHSHCKLREVGKMS